MPPFFIMGIKITRAKLFSTIARLASTGDSNGIRYANTSLETVDITNTDEPGGLVGIAQNFLERIAGKRGANLLTRSAGWILNKATGALKWSATSVFGWAQQATIQLWNFDWNQTDAEIKARGAADNVVLASVWGSAAGTAIGWTIGAALGYGVSLLLPVIGAKQLANYVTQEVLAEGLEEAAASVGSAINVTANVITRQAARTAFVGGRKFIRLAQGALITTLRGEQAGQDFADFQYDNGAWGGERQPAWSWSSGTSDLIQRLPPVGAAFFDSLLDETADALVEVGYVVASLLDAEMNKQSYEKLANPERGVVIYPDRENPDDGIVLTGDQKEVMQSAEVVLAQHRNIANKDVGEIASIPLFETVTPITSKRTLTITFQEYDRPPYTREGIRSRTTVLKVSDAKTGITFNELKLACRRFTFGGTRATMQLDNGRQLAVYGSTSAECDDVLRGLLTLTTAEPVRTTYTDVNSGVEPWQRKDIRLVFPSKAVMVVRRTVPLQGNVIQRTEKIDLWRERPIGLDVFR